MTRPRPPYFATKFFLWYAKESLQECILGDLEEQFEEDQETYGNTRARWRFVWNVLRFFRRGIIKPYKVGQKLTGKGMIKNDIKTSLRIIRREKLYSTINILGLASGFVIAILILVYIRFEQSYESYNPNAANMVRITMDYLDGEVLIDQDCESYHLLGPMIQEEFPEVVDFTRAFRFGLGFEVNGKVFQEPTVYAVDPSFLPLFGYDLLHGDAKTALQESRQIVLTESSAQKLFGRTDVVGEQIKMSAERTLSVVGVVRDSPANTHLKFNMLVSYASIKKMLAKRDDPWDSNDTFTYLSLSDSESYPSFQKNLARLSDRLRKEDLIPDERIVSEKISDIHLHSNKSYEAEQNGSATIVFFLLGVALLVIIIAVLNYINLSTAKAMDRAKEAGIRKVIGSSVAQLRARFFIESVMLNLMAGVLAIGVIFLVFEPYKHLAGLPLSLQIATDVASWMVLVASIIASTCLSGIVPAFVMGTFKPLEVLKGKFTHSFRGIFMRKVLVVIQFSIAIFLLVQTFTANRQLTYMLNKDLGMNDERVVVIQAPPPEGQKRSISTFKTSLISRAAFLEVALSNTVPGLATSTMGSTTNLELDEVSEELKNNFYIYHVDSNFFSTMEMEIIAGNDFKEPSSYENPIIINEAALRVWRIADPKEVIDKKSTFWGRENTIVGVVKDFHQLGPKSDHIPLMILLYGPNHEPDYISVRLGKGTVMDQVAELESVYLSHFPASTFEFFFLDQNFEKQYRADEQFRQIFNILSVFAVLITCLGLFGLASFNVAKRTKEIGIRKVLGASVPQVIRLLSRDFVALVATSMFIALPATWFLVNNWLNQYSFRIVVDVWLFLIPTVIVLLVALATILPKTYTVSNMNPVKALRDE